MKNSTALMLPANTIPDFSGESEASAKSWWDAMLEKDLYIHPEDDPASIVDAATSARVFDDEACKKIASIYDRMFALLGEEKNLRHRISFLVGLSRLCLEPE